MSHRQLATASGLFASVLLVAACTSGQTYEAPAAPAMPEGWRVTSDLAFGRADIDPISESLGGFVAQLRNTTYDVEGKPVKLNTILAGSSEDADRIMASLRKLKPDDFIHRDGLTIYEFVGTDYVIPEMNAGMVFVKAASGS